MLRVQPVERAAALTPAFWHTDDAHCPRACFTQRARQRRDRRSLVRQVASPLLGLAQRTDRHGLVRNDGLALDGCLARVVDHQCGRPRLQQPACRPHEAAAPSSTGSPPTGVLATAKSCAAIRPEWRAMRPASIARRNAWAIAAGSRAFATA